MDYPKSLFKYSRFKDYSLDMIDRGYIYFCPANKLDDQFECLSSWEKYKDLHLETIIEVVRETLSELGLNVPNIPFSSFYDGTSLNSEKVLKFIKNNESTLLENQIIKGIDFVKSMENISFPVEMEEGMKKTVLMQDFIGICSLAEDNRNQVMWAMYANNYNGYCIEYDVASFLINNPKFKDDLLKVNYSANREIDLIKSLLKRIYSELLINIGLPIEICNDEDLKSKLVKIATTKYLDWSFQREWRFIGIPNDKSIILPIKAVYIGKKLSMTNKRKIVQKCKKNWIPVYIQKDDYSTLEIDFLKYEEEKYGL